MAEEPANKVSFFQRILDSLFGGNDPEVQKKRQLKEIAKELAKSHSNFYKFSTDEVQPGLAKLFYQIYKAVSPAQILVQSLHNSAAIKNQIVTSALTEEQMNLSQELTEPSIREKAKNIPANKLAELVQQKTDAFISSFDIERITKIDSIYTAFLHFQSFCSYDFYFLLKKFCASLKEHDFSETPHFEPIASKYIKEDLQDFIAVAWLLERDLDWTSVLAFLKTLKGAEPISNRNWTQIVSKINILKRERSLEKVIKLAMKDPLYESSVTNQSNNVVEPFIDKVKNEALQAVSKLQNEKKKNQVDNLLTQLFGTESILRLKYYTDEANPEFVKHNLPIYSFYQPLNYLKAFLLDFVKTDLRTFSDLVLVRGQWTSTPLATPMSEAYNELLDYSNKITAFDESLSAENTIGIKIKTLMPRTLREKDAANIASNLIEDANEEAKGYLLACSKDFVIIGRTIKSLLEDYAKLPRSEIIINWKELEHFADEPIKETGVAIYKKIYLFTMLMQTMIAN